MNKYQNSLCYIDSILLDEDVLRIFDSPNYPPLIKNHIKLLQELVDKETPKNVVKRTMPIIDEVYCCSKCGQQVELTQNYCDKCGQRLGWEVEDE